MAATNQRVDDRVDVARLAELLAEAGLAPQDYLPEERVSGYLSRLADGSLMWIPGVRDGRLGAALLYSRFGPVYPVRGSFLRLSGLYVDEVVVTADWRGRGWSRWLFDSLRRVEGTEQDIYIDCDARNGASLAMMRSAGFEHVADYVDPPRSEPSGPPRTTSLFRLAGHPEHHDEER